LTKGEGQEQEEVESYAKDEEDGKVERVLKGNLKVIVLAKHAGCDGERRREGIDKGAVGQLVQS
jgi:hypothetical protein